MKSSAETASIVNFRPNWTDCCNILIFGQFGHGKSSFINTLKSAVTGKRVVEALVGASEDHVTVDFKRYELTPFIASWDPWGWSNSNYRKGELMQMMRGLVKHGQNKDRKLIQQTSQDAMERNKIDIVFFCISAEVVRSGNTDYMKQLKEFHGQLMEEGHHPYVVLTKIDEIKDDKGIPIIDAASPNCNIASVESHPLIKEIKGRIIKEMGPNVRIYPVINYNQDDTQRRPWIETSPLSLLLEALQQRQREKDDGELKSPSRDDIVGEMYEDEQPAKYSFAGQRF